MHRRGFVIAAVFLLVACRLTSVKPFPPTATVIPATTQAPTSVTVTESPTSQPDSLEVISSGNWSRLQLLKTFPAETPLNHSAVAISPDGKTLAVGSSSGATIHFFDLPGGQLSRTVPISGVSNPDSYFNVIEYLPDGTLIANADGPYMIYHIDAAGNVLATWDGMNFALSTDKKLMARTDMEGIVLVEIANDTPFVLLSGGSGFEYSFSPDGSKIAAEDVGVDYIHTAIWDISSQTILTTLDETAAPRYSPDGAFLAAIRYDYENDRTPLKIFSPDGKTEVTTLNVSEPDDLINRAPAWSVDGSVLVAQVSNGSSTAWDVANWQPLETPVLQGLVSSFSPDGRILITRADDGAILLWGVVP